MTLALYNNTIDERGMDIEADGRGVVKALLQKQFHPFHAGVTSEWSLKKGLIP